jgi:XTP/dITP diphosphohydrolase
MVKILIATNNQGKLKEIRSLLDSTNLQLVSPAELELQLEVREDGSSYQENAALKATAFAKASGLVVLADDTGLEVAALNGAPGLYSARFSSRPAATDADRRQYLLERLQAYPPPWEAQFRCVIALKVKDQPVRFAEGICTGQIIPEEHGEHGFGYDPIFFLPQVERTMAELTMEEKNRLSHRAVAIRSAIPMLLEMISNG